MTEPSILKRLSHLELAVERLERVTIALVPHAGAWLASELRLMFSPGETFSTREAWDRADAMRIAAAGAGDPIPDIALAMETADVKSIRGLSLFLAQHEGKSTARVCRGAGGTVWTMLDISS